MGVAAPATATTERTISTASVEEGGWVTLGHGDGAPHALEPADAGIAVPEETAGRAAEVIEAVEVIAVIAHLSDLHVCDAESPARQEHLDRHGDPGAPYQWVLGDIGTYRPQELFTVPVAIAMVETTNLLAGGPASAAPIDAVVLTGDLIDNAQANELEWYLTVVNGGEVRPTSGDPGACDWVGAPTATWSPAYWHPDGHPGGQDHWTARHGFPRVEGLLPAARSVMRSPGLAAPSFGVHGNHDALAQGTVPTDERLERLAVGASRAIGLAPGSSPLVVLETVPRVGPARWPDLDGAPTEAVAADRARRFVRPNEFAERGATGPSTGDAGAVRRGPGHAYSARIAPEVRLLALDTVNPHGGWEGSLDRAQFEWALAELDDAAVPYWVVASHHPSWCLMNPYRPDGADDRVLADEVLRALFDRPQVVVWLAGHVHHHSITVHRRGERVLPEITSASLIDWPQQSRLLEILRDRDGRLRLVSTAIDHLAPVGPPNAVSESDHLGVAAWSRLLARNAPLLRDHVTRRDRAGAAGWWSPQNCVLWVPDPTQG